MVYFQMNCNFCSIGIASPLVSLLRRCSDKRTAGRGHWDDSSERSLSLLTDASPNKMLHDARMAAMRKPRRSVGWRRQWPVRAGSYD